MEKRSEPESLSPVTLRRLEDGQRALRIAMPDDPSALRGYRAEVANGILALQSTDDLGPELNRRIWEDLKELERRYKLAGG